MNKEMVQQRLQRLKSEREQMVANVHAYDGAIQEVQHWLDELDKPTTEEAVDGKQE